MTDIKSIVNKWFFLVPTLLTIPLIVYHYVNGNFEHVAILGIFGNGFLAILAWINYKYIFSNFRNTVSEQFFSSITELEKDEVKK